MRVLEKSSSELNELRLRIQHLEKRQELPRGDVLLPDVVSRILIDQWLDVQMGREGWQLVQDALAPRAGRKNAGGLQGRQRIPRVQRRDEGDRPSVTGQESPRQPVIGWTTRFRQERWCQRRQCRRRRWNRLWWFRWWNGLRWFRSRFRRRWPAAAKAVAMVGGLAGGAGWPFTKLRWCATGLGQRWRAAPAWARHPVAPRLPSMGVNDETRLLTGSSPLARARMRAQGVVGRLKRLLIRAHRWRF